MEKFLSLDFYAVLGDLCPVLGGSGNVKFWKRSPLSEKFNVKFENLGRNILPPNDFFGETELSFDAGRKPSLTVTNSRCSLLYI